MLLPFNIAAGFGRRGFDMRSLRFDGSSAYCSITPSGAGNRKLLAFRFHIKRSKLGATQVIASAGTASIDRIYFNSSDQLCLDVLGTARLVTTQVFRDVTDWYCDVGFFLDVANGTAALRAGLLVDGEEVSSYSTDGRASITNTDTNWNNTVVHYLGRDNSGSYFGGYLADLVEADGSTSITNADEDASTGQIIPVSAPTFTPGTNGFWLSFDNNTSTATLGYDDAGGARGAGAGSNDWTLNNFSVTAGVNNDSLKDCPINFDDGANGQGNFCTINPLLPGLTVSDGALQSTFNSNDLRGTIAITEGKWVFEAVFTGIASTTVHVGFLDVSSFVAPWGWSSSTFYAYRNDGNKMGNGSNTAYGAAWTTNDVIRVELDLDTGTLEFFKNGTSQGVAFNSGLTGKTFVPMVSSGNAANNTAILNFGQRPFANTPTTNFKALCTQNLPEPAILLPGKHFDVRTYAGSGSTVTVNDVDFQPDIAWFKNRGNAQDHKLVQVISGNGYGLEPNTTDDVALDNICTLTSNGFTLNTGNRAYSDSNADAFVSWLLRAGGNPSANSDGSISSSVSVNAVAGISVGSYTGTGTNGTVGHGLGAAPVMILVKALTTAGTDQGWVVYHKGVAADAETDYLVLNSATAAADLNTVWNDTAPTSSVFSIGTAAGVNVSGDPYLFIAFAEVESFSKFGTYTGNANADGPFVWCRFRPKFVLVKSSSAGTAWFIEDSVRDTYNPITSYLLPNSTAIEATSGGSIDFLSNGFKLRSTTAGINGSTATLVFAAFAEAPFKYARAG